MLIKSSQIRDIAQKLPVRAVTTTALAANTYANGTAGAGATLTASGNGIIAAVDGVTLVNGDRVLVKNEVTTANNGIYIVTTIGSAGTPYILTRADDSNSNARVFPGISVFSTADGTTNASQEWVLNTTTNPLIIGTTAQTWAAQVIVGSVPTASNKEMTGSATTADFQAMTATAMASTPTSDGYVEVFVNGARQTVGNGVKTKDCYFSSDGGTTAKAISAIASGDICYWVGSVAGWQIAATDIIDFLYDV